MIKNKAEKLRFGLVGVANTSIDMGLFFTLAALGLPTITANILSTSAAFCFSFFANKKFTFKTTGNAKREVFLFIIVTLFGLWVIQSIIIKLAIPLLDSTPLPHTLALIIAKVLAVSASLVWNYIFYAHVVFKKRRDD
jgi:putative flippase GtrA